MKKSKKIRKPDVTNHDPKYWEQVLETYGLGLKQLGLQERVETNPERLEDIDDHR